MGVNMKSLGGSFLVARSVLKDSFFGQTVIFLLQHNKEGAFGLVLNRPAPVKELPFPLFVGGPCKFDGLIMLHGHKDWMSEEELQEVCPGVFLGDADCIGRVSEPDGDQEYRFRVFSGYSGWGPKQLEREMSEGSWAVVPATAEHIFDTSHEDLWAILVPPSLPQPSRN
jgi:putative transcriptional regulator